MTAPISGLGATASVGAPVTAPNRDRDEAKLKESAKQLEALFVQQLFTAMRANVPTDGILEKGPGEDLFTSMLDQKVAETVAAQNRGPADLSASLFDALRQRLGSSADTPR